MILQLGDTLAEGDRQAGLFWDFSPLPWGLVIAFAEPELGDGKADAVETVT